MRFRRKGQALPPEPTGEEIRISRADPAARGATVGSGAGAEAEDRLSRALTAFNRSPQAAIVRGLTRTLGPPSAAVGAGQVPGEVRVTVAWELTWYQWCLDPDRPEAEVREVASGTEMSQLDQSARHFNATVAGDGTVALRAPARHGGAGR